MRWAGRRVGVYAHTAPTDMRKGFDSLCGMVTERLARNPLSGDVFLFVSRDRIRCLRRNNLTRSCAAGHRAGHSVSTLAS